VTHACASRTPARIAEAQAWVTGVAPAKPARILHAIAAIPLEHRGHGPAWGPLAFEPIGRLLVLTRAGVVRIDPDAGDEASADGVSPWQTAVTSPDGAMRWIEAYDACDGVALRATFASGDDMRDVALPVAPPLGDRCIGSRGALALPVPVAWGPGGLEALVEGEPVLVAQDLAHATVLASFLGASGHPGGPRSTDGKTTIVPTSVGLVEQGASHTRLLRAHELDGTYADQHDCAVSDDGTRVACVRAGKAWVGTWEAP
jgi:hypothetical protein